MQSIFISIILAIILLVDIQQCRIIEFNENDQNVDDILMEIGKLTSNLTSVEALIESEGYPVETHHVITPDGYILTLHRIPYGNTYRNLGKVAFLQHGILSSSADWVIMGKHKALAYTLADEGYDVWLGNARGNTQSRHHIKYNPDLDSEFWQFSWHEIGIIDLPAMIDYVLNETRTAQLYFAGHSQGSTAFYVMASSLPEYNEKIKVQVSLAPVAYMNHMTSPLIKIIAFWDTAIELLLNIIGLNEFLPTSDFIRNVMADQVCKKNSVTQLLCTNTLFAICGFSPNEMNTTLLPIIMQFTPAGSSTKQLLHYAQEVNSGHFRQYDFGIIKNLEKYHSIHPPDYDLSKIHTPVYLLYSHNDWLSSEKDVDRLCTGMHSSCKGSILMSDLQFNHLDFMFGIHARTLVYDKVISLFARY